VTPRAAAAIALLAGAATVGAFAPVGFYPLAFVGFAALIHLWIEAPRSADAFRIGFLFGLGLFGCGVSWVYVSLHRFGAMPAPLAAIATFAFCAVLSLYPALAGWLQARVRAPQAIRAVFVIPALWTLTEWLRGWVLTGFPWLSAGYAGVDTPLAGLAPLGGVYAMSLATLVCAGLLWCVARGRGRWPAATVLAAVLAAGWAMHRIQWTTPAGAPFRAALLQGDVPQDLKFDPQRYADTLETYARLAEQAHAKLIVLPETALPRFLDSINSGYLQRLAAIGRRNGGDILLGVPVRTAPGKYYNSVISLGSSPTQIYSKIHLVPFGEFVPPGFGWIVRVLSIPLADFSRGAADQKPLAVAGQRVAVDICYEDAYGAAIARAARAATLLVNVSNVAWFGDSLAPAQHLEIARVRALETGRMMLTATNTGVTAAIGPDGRVLARLPEFVVGRLEVDAQGYAGATPYARIGDWGALALALALLASACLVARAGRSR